ncbi:MULTISPECIES: TerD family protein [unclassified Acinetobacter]|uniref:TerD family protein n=1 Tax=unclassified Acinetobacter TaxID=196816 RepID=UPI0035B94C7E
MAVTLAKGQGISLKKSEYDLSKVVIGLGWDMKKQGFFSKLMGKGEYDLDVAAFLLDGQGRIANLSEDMASSDIVFYNNLKHFSSAIWLTGDNRTGAGDGDDEQIIVRLNDLSPQYQRIVFIVQIYNGIKNKQHFGEVDNAFIRAVDANGKEMVRFNLSTHQQYAGQCSLLFAELVRNGSHWDFNAIGESSPADSFVSWLQRFQ